jgi:acyl-CoA reductase-like NAD-dependent aldehyde dehydrogenase
VIKPASRAPGGTVALAQALHDAGIPEDVFQVVFGGAAVGQALVGRAAQTGVLDAIRHGVEHGATVVAGGGDGPDEHGCYVDPTVVVGAEPGTPMIDAEVFGPVAAVVKAADVNEAIALANATPFGLSASVCTNDLGSALEQGRAAIEFFTEGQTVYLEAAPGGSAG